MQSLVIEKMTLFLQIKYVWTYGRLLFPELKWKKHLSYNNTYDKNEFGHRGVRS